MTSDPTPTGKHSHGLVLTQAALKLVDQALSSVWEQSALKKESPKGKLRRDDKEILLGLDRKTVDKMYRHEPVHATTLRHVFQKLKILPGFSIEEHCVSVSPLAGNLKQMPTACIGRETQVEEIEAHLALKRLVTLTGTGGVGKTRLALQIAQETKSHYPDGIWLVELAGVSDGALVLQTVATTLGLQERTNRSLLQALSDFLCGKSLLLILDNCEHLLDACATLTHHLLSSSSALKVLATSRERLNIGGEHPYRVPSLSVPDLKRLSEERADIEKLQRDYASVRLFVERASEQRSDLAWTDQDVRLLASLCHRLDGIPLAIELAAGRMGGMSLDVLERGLNDCFRLLIGGNRAALSRHRTLQATMDWSYSLLKEKEQALLRRLAVFADGCGWGALEQVCSGGGLDAGDVLDLLTSLVDKNLVVFQERDGKARYHLLETVRQYGQQRLTESGERETVRGRHRDCFLAFAEEADPKLKGVGQAEWLRRLEKDHENLRAALEWSLAETGSSACLQLCGALQKFWGMLGHFSEGREWCIKALGTSRGQERSQERAKVLNTVGGLAIFQGDYVSAQGYLEESRAIYKEVRDQFGIATSNGNLGHVASSRGNYASARAYYEESLTSFREIKDRNSTATALNSLGYVAREQGDYVSAKTYYEESLAIRREIGDQSGRAFVLNDLGELASYQGNYASARDYLEQGLIIFKDSKARSGIANSLFNLGNVTISQGDEVAANTYYQESLALYKEMGDRRGIANSLDGLGNVAISQDDNVSAKTYYEESLSIRREIEDRSGMAYSFLNLGNVTISQGDEVAALAYYQESLALFQTIGDRRGIAYSLEAFAALARLAGKMERAGALWGAAELLREKVGLSLHSSEQKAYDNIVAEVRQTLGERAFKVAWTAGRVMTVEQAIEYALKKPGS